MINDKNFNQEAGDNSSLIQAETININNGISYGDARQMFLDLFDANFLKLKEEAATVASNRAKEITERFLSRLYAENPETVQQLGQPGMQASLYTAQKTYAISGDQQAQDLLLELLFERAATHIMPTFQSTIDEAITKVEKLTKGELDLLTLHFVLHENDYHFPDWNSFLNYLNTELGQFMSFAGFQPQTYARLQHLGCSYLNSNKTISLANRLLRRFPGFFCRGFTKKQFYKSAHGLEERYPLETYLIPCHFNKSLFQLNINTIDRSDLKGILKLFIETIVMRYQLSEQKLNKALNSVHSDIIVKLITIMKTPFSRLSLTDVGLALSIAHYQVITKKKVNLTLYITDKTTDTISDDIWEFAISLYKSPSPYGDLL